MPYLFSRFAKSQVRFFLFTLLGVVALFGGSVAPVSAERDEPGLPVDLRAHCERLGYDLIIHPQDLKDPDGKSWRCATISEWNVTESSSTDCEMGIGVEVEVKKLPTGNFEVQCSWEDGHSVAYTVTHMESVDVNAACAHQYRQYDAENDSWVTFYEADSHDWSDPFAWGCYSTLPEF